jgi:hypothetical protein
VFSFDGLASCSVSLDCLSKYSRVLYLYLSFDGRIFPSPIMPIFHSVLELNDNTATRVTEDGRQYAPDKNQEKHSRSLKILLWHIKMARRAKSAKNKFAILHRLNVPPFFFTGRQWAVGLCSRSVHMLLVFDATVPNKLCTLACLGLILAPALDNLHVE